MKLEIKVAIYEDNDELRESLLSGKRFGVTALCRSLTPIVAIFLKIAIQNSPMLF